MPKRPVPGRMGNGIGEKTFLVLMTAISATWFAMVALLVFRTAGWL